MKPRVLDRESKRISMSPNFFFVVANMPSTSIHASYGATVNIGDIACVSTHQYRK